MPVTVLRKAREIIAIRKSHVAGHDVPKPTATISIAKTQAIEVILERSHALFFVKLGKRKVFTDGVRTCIPVELDFAPLELIEESRNRIVLSEHVSEFHNLESRSKFKTVRLRNRPVILLDIRRIKEIEIVRDRFLLVKVRRELHIERQERNQLRIKINPELLISRAFVTEDAISTAIFTMSNAIDLVERSRVIADFIGIRVLQVNRHIVLGNRIRRDNHKTIARDIDLSVGMVVVKDVTASKEATFIKAKEVFLRKAFTVATAKHITSDIHTVVHGKERQDVPTHIQLMIEFCGISHYLIDLRFHKVRIARLVHIAYIVKIKERQVESLRPRFKFRLREVLEPRILGKPFERLKLEHAKRTQLILNQCVVRVSRIRRGRRTAFRLVVRIAQRRTFQERLREEFSKLRFTGLVILVVADAKAQVLRIGFITLRFSVIAQPVFFIIRIHCKVALEHVPRQVDKATLLEHHVIRGFHVRTFCRAVVAQRHRDVVSKRIVQELVERDRNVSRYIELGCCRCQVRLRRTSRVGKRCKVAILIAHRTRKRNEVSKIDLAIHTGGIAPFRIHIRKAEVINPERTFEIFRRSRRVRNNHKANPVHLRNGGITHQAELFFSFTVKLLDYRFQVRRMAATLKVREIRHVHRKGVVNPVLFMAILYAVRSARRLVQVSRAEAPFIIVARAINRAFTELQSKTHRHLARLRLIMDFHFQGLVRREILCIRFKQARHAHFLTWTHIVVVKNKGCFFQRSVRIGIAFRDRIRRLEIRFRIFAVVDCRNLDVGRIARCH